jgi:arylsulfatase A-like enzyme
MLRSEHLLDKTIVIVTSDHGEEFQEHGGLLHGRTLYEEQLHVPLFLSFRGSHAAVPSRGWPATSTSPPPCSSCWV